MTNRACSRGMVALGSISLALAGCDSTDASKPWSTLAACIAGPAATLPLIERAQKLRQFQLASAGTAAGNDAWPKKCSAPADELYAALDKSGKTALLRRKLADRFGCNEQKGSCKVPADASLLSIATELWELAEKAELKLEGAAGAPAPAAAAPPVVDAKSWKSFSPKPLRLSGPALTSDGRAVVVLKAAEGRTRPIGCEFSPGFAKVRCLPENSKIPELPSQSVDVVSDSKGVYAAGLTEEGLVAYNLETGETSPVGGRTGRLVREGAVVDRPSPGDISTAGLPEPPGKARGMFAGKQEDPGYVVRELAGNKASKDIPVKIQGAIGDPYALGSEIVYLSPAEEGPDLVTMSVARGRVSAPKTLKGPFTGTVNTCRRGDDLAVAVFAGRKGQGRAEATGGDGKTRFTLTLFRNGAWTKPVEATLPYERATESDLVCTANGASIAWAQPADGGATVGRLDCTSDGCKASDVKLTGIEPVYFWLSAPLGEKTLLLYRSTLGETRLRVAPLAELGSAKETILFDTPDFGGPTTGELLPALSDEAALLIFRGEQPVALRVGADGAANVVAP